jgi:PKD repeat protein
MLAAQSEQAQEVEEPTTPLTVEITSTDTEGGGEAIAPATFEFEADITGGIEPYTISWNFGEGSREVSDDDDVVEHTFEEAGSYDVGLTVTDSGGQSASDSMEITVEEAPPAEVVEEEEVEEEEQPLPPAEEEVEEEEQPLPPAEEEVEEEEQPSLADEIAESIEDEVDAFVDDFLARFGVNN